MKISKLSIKNFKGLDGSWKLDPVVLVHGPNCTGKTALALAIKLACAGKLPPPIGKLGQSIYRLAGNPDSPGSMRVEIETDKGKLVWREWSRNESGAVSASANIEDELISDALLDFRGLFLSKTGAERTAMILEQCDFKYTLKDLEKAISEAGLDPESPVITECIPAKGRNPARVWLDQIAKEVAAACKQARQDAKSCADTTAKLVKMEPAKTADYTAEIARLKHELAKAEEHVASEAHRKQLCDNLRALKKQLESLNEAGILATKEALLAELGTSKQAEVSLDQQLKAFKKTYDQYTLDLNKLTVEEATLESHISFLSRLDNAEFCLVCGASREYWTSRMMPDKNRLSKVKEMRVALEQSIARALSEIESAQKQLNMMLVKQKSIEIELTKTDRQLDSVKDLKERIALIQSELGDGQCEQMGALDEARALREKLFRLVQEQSKHNAWIEWKQRVDEAEHKTVSATRTEKVLRQFADVVTQERMRLINTSIGDYLALANECGGCLLNTPLAFHPERQEFGRMQNGGWISLDTFSGFEEMVACAGLALAMSNDSPIRLLVLDEMGRLTDDRKQCIVGLMKQLVDKGLLDNCIMIDVSPDAYETCDVQCIHLE